MSFPARVLLGFAVGTGAGLSARALFGDDASLAWFVRNVSEPAGKIFLRLIFMLVIPLVVSALALGVVNLGDLRRIGRIGLKMLGYTIVVSTAAVLIGVLLVNTIRPGDGLSEDVRSRLAEQAKGSPAPAAKLPTGVQLLVSIVPDNVFRAASEGDMLGIMFFALALGIGLSITPGTPVVRLREAIEGLYHVVLRLLGLVLQLAPLGIAALLFTMTARFGWELLGQLGQYVAVVIAALAIHQFVVYSISVRFFGGLSPVRFFAGAREAMLTAFSTSSSSATLPTTLRVAREKLAIPDDLANFVLTLGATANQNGTALFEGVTVLFLAQFYGVDLALGTQVLVVLVCILGGIGTAGVPAASLPVIALVCGMIGVPVEGVGIILGVDRLLDMCRTTVNVTGDLAAAVFLARSEKAAG